MLPQRPPHISQDLWELELPSILGMAHPAMLDDAEDDAEDNPESSPSVETIGATTTVDTGHDGDDAGTPAAAASSTSVSPASASASAQGRTAADSAEHVDLVDLVDSDGVGLGDENNRGQLQLDTPALIDGHPPTAAPAFASNAADSGQWSEIWNADVPTCGFAVHRLQLDSLLLPQPPASDSPEMEHLAYYVCSKGICTTRDLRKLCSLLPAQASAKRRRTSTSDGDTGRLQRSFSVGAYSMGGVQGVQNHTYTFPWTACWFTSMILAVAPMHRFSTCTLLHNVMSFKHTDSRNAPHTNNIIVPCDFWRGGQLWIANPQGSIHLDSKSGPGILRTVAHPYLQFCPTTPHATYPWSHGDRTILVAHHARGLEALSTAQRRTLADMGFQLLDTLGAESRDADAEPRHSS